MTDNNTGDIKESPVFQAAMEAIKANASGGVLAQVAAAVAAGVEEGLKLRDGQNS